ncbi:MAG TPA: hypothetical protein VFX30_13825 [bacterium]|nr:hypothetical protein [bacterium]
MSGTECANSGGKTFIVRQCSDLDASSAGDAFGAFCKVNAGIPNAGALITRAGDVATIDLETTTAEDLDKGQVYLINPNGGPHLLVKGLSQSDIKTTLARQGENVSPFELCEAGANPFRTLLAYVDGRTAKIDDTVKVGSGQLAISSPDGKSTRRISGLSADQIKLTRDYQGSELGSCGSSEGTGTSYAVMPTRTSQGSVISWSLDDLLYFKKHLGGVSNRAFFCANARDVELDGAGNPVLTIAVNTNAGYRAVLHPLVETLAAGDCPMGQVKCDAAFSALRVYASDVETSGEKTLEMGKKLLDAFVFGFIAGTMFALANRWFGGGHGGGGLAAASKTETKTSPSTTQAPESAARNLTLAEFRAAFPEVSPDAPAALPAFKDLRTPNSSAPPVFVGPIGAPVLVPAY